MLEQQKLKPLNHIGTQTIKTERLILRAFKVEDADDMYIWASNENVGKYLSYPLHESPEATAELLKGWVNGYESNETYNWAIELNGKVIGSISVINTKSKSFSCELGWQIDSSCWNKGYMTEAANAVIDFLFGRVGYNRIGAGHDSRNIGSGRVMEKAGMTCEGVQRQMCFLKDGSIGDMKIWSILRDEWNKNNE